MGDIALTLNEVKTFPLRREYYEAWLRQPEERWAAINEGAEIELRDVAGYVEAA